MTDPNDDNNADDFDYGVHIPGLDELDDYVEVEEADQDQPEVKHGS